MDKKYGKLINIAMWSAIVLFVIRCVVSWKSIVDGVTAYELFGYAGEAIGVAVIFTAFYEQKLWRYNPWETAPKLYAKYVGTFSSTYDNVVREGTLDIKQTLLTVSVIFSTKESKSRSLSASIDEIMGEKQLTYCFMNIPESKYRDRSKIHFGTAMLTISEDGTLKGQYYTERKTLVDMEFVTAQK